MAANETAASGGDDIDLDNPPFPLTAIDRGLLAMRDEDFHRITWSDLREIIANNTLEELKRTPSDLRRYLAWSHATKARYGSITNFVIRERLHWTPLPPTSTSDSTSTSTSSSSTPPRFAHASPIPFADPTDYAVLPNDWPYGFADGIAHFLVWSKTPVAVDDVRGDVTEASRRRIEEFVAGHFVAALGPTGAERVVWFKNWVNLQSVRGVDHVHVLVRDAPEEVVRRWMERRDL